MQAAPPGYLSRRLLLVALASYACSATTITANDYDRTCLSSADCVVVAEGEMCAQCSPCPNASINRRDADRYGADQERSRSRCMSRQQVPCAGCPIPPEAICNDGTCTAVPTRQDVDGGA